MTTTEQLELKSINTIRTLSMDAVQAANSGHPGTPMALAPVVYCLWQRFLRFDPDDPMWPNRDRFVLSNGHASMLLYSLLHLTGVKAVNPDYEVPGTPAVSLDDIKAFRQLGSKCPGHPEYRQTSGVETTTGVLGQGVATAVGMAIAGKWLAAHFNRPNFKLFDYRVYAMCGDGCLMEGISSEAASIAGHLGLNNLCWIYDNNRITLEGNTALAFSEDVTSRFLSYGWNVTRVGDANSLERLEQSFRVANNSPDRPTLIIVDSHIGYGAPHKQDTMAAHALPLGEHEIRGAKRKYAWPEDAKFLVPSEVLQHFDGGIGKRGRELHAAWRAMRAEYTTVHPEMGRELDLMERRELPDEWDADLPVFAADSQGLPTREASALVLNEVARGVPWLIGGSADVNPATKTQLVFDTAGDFSIQDRGGRNLHFGVRELAMGAILNGLALCKVRGYGSTLFVFSDYVKPALRLASMMELPVIYVFTHDSILVGEDGSTHQPIEQLAALRATPNLVTIRPGDANEVSEAWRAIMRLQHQPAALVLTREAVPILDRSRYAPATGLHQGAYILAEARDGQPEVIMIATGGSVPICAEAYEKLTAEGVRVRLVSMPSWDLFERQSPEYRNQILPPNITARVSVEMGSTFGWSRYVSSGGTSLGIARFGTSAPMKELLKRFGFTIEQVTTAVMGQLAKHRKGHDVAG